MFKKKLNLSALANKPIEQENKTSIEKDTIIWFEEKIIENNNIKEIVHKETEINNEIKTEEIIEKEIKIEDNKIEDAPKFNYTLKSFLNEKNQNNNESKKIEQNQEIKQEKIIEKEVSKSDDSIKINISEKIEISDKIIEKEEIDVEKEEIDVEKEESDEEREKRYLEMTSKVEVSKNEFDYDKEEKIEIFSNYKSDLDKLIIDDKKIEDTEPIEITETIEINEPIEKDEKLYNFEIIKKEEKESEINKNEEIIIKKPINKKIIYLILFMFIIIISIALFIFMDKKQSLEKVDIDSKTNSWVIINTWSLSSTWEITDNNKIIDEVFTNSWIVDIVDETIKEEVEIYIEEIKWDNLKLTPEEIKKKINDKIIEIYLKKTMWK